ncbi:MAG: hypothetical protein QNJ45_10685 [Ardenticatenaceae bacterium]|nr:hypothetical protein [Ardenticatenaceae bacterium]
MPVIDLLPQAVANNAWWCEWVTHAHQGQSAWSSSYWLNQRPSPPFYPNLITLTADHQLAQLQAVSQLTQLNWPAGWGVKDSFAALDLQPHGFFCAVTAAWLTVSLPSQLSENTLQWRQVAEKEALLQWEAAWGGSADRPLFQPQLLSNSQIAIIAGYADGQVVCGGIATKTDQIVGISNLFFSPGMIDPMSVRPVLLHKLSQVFPGRPLVGYEADEDLAAMVALGAQTLGPLRIWIKN